MVKIVVCGTGPDVGKTVVSAILVKALNASYWKPIQCGNLDASDSSTVDSLVQHHSSVCYPECYRFQHPLSPHHAARLENKCIDPNTIIPPQTELPLIIECAGGVLVPLTTSSLQLDLFSQWDCLWVLVSKLYLGSINHSLLTIEALKHRNVNLIGIIFNGDPNPDSENVILNYSNAPMIGRLPAMSSINPKTINLLASSWKSHPCLASLLCQQAS